MAVVVRCKTSNDNIHTDLYSLDELNSEFAPSIDLEDYIKEMDIQESFDKDWWNDDDLKIIYFDHDNIDKESANTFHKNLKEKVPKENPNYPVSLPVMGCIYICKSCL